MDKLFSKLQAQARAHPTNSVLRRVISGLHHLHNTHARTSETEARYEQLNRDIAFLVSKGLWVPSEEEEKILRELQKRLALLPSSSGNDTNHDSSPHLPSNSSDDSRYPGNSSDRQDPRGISIVQPPPLSTPLLPAIASLTPTVLPIELVQTLNHTFFLHLLATDPERVLPPGKSLLSMMSGPRANTQTTDGDIPQLESRVKDVVHAAFWKEALESLSNPSPAVQVPRLKSLYEDFLAALKPLLPPSHPVLLTLSLPLSPTSAPLRSAILHLREILVALRQRCAPARDAYIDKLLNVVDETSPLAATADLARTIINTAGAILELAEAMKEDLSQFVLGSMDEKDLKVMINQQAMLREKTLVLQMWPPSRIEPAWKTWLDELELDSATFTGSDTVSPSHRRWTFGLVQALGSGFPVNCPLPTRRITVTDSENAAEEEDISPPNALPPAFFVTCPALLAAQNYLQALVIAASLRSLVRLPSISPSSDSTSTGDNGHASFTQRVWTLLKASVDEEPGADDTKIINLADEVVRVRGACADPEHPCGPEEEAHLRAAVDRTLQLHDPVFLLLQRRLLQALAAWLVSAPERHVNGDASAEGRAAALVHMQTGRERAGSGVRPRLRLGLENPKSVFAAWRRERGRIPVVKGFEDDVLVRAVRETFGRVAVVVDWTDRLWQDLIESGEIGGSSEGMRPEDTVRISGS